VCICYLYHLPPPFGLLFLQFCRRKNIKDGKKDMAFCQFEIKIAVWEILVLLPCTCVLQPKLVHLYQTPSLLPSALPMVTSASWGLLYSFLYSDYINHIQGFGFLPLPYPSHVQSPFSVWPMSNNITAFVWGL
jgi:hypothetical protein